VTLFESARTLGGRARKVEIDGRNIDNGQHILLGAYSETLRMMKIVGIDPEQALLHLPLQMRYPPNSGGMDFVARRLPAPFHLMAALWKATGLARQDKLALARFSTTARWMDWRLNADCSVSQLLEQFDQTERLTRLMWRPLCLAALNTPPERASAQVFLNVLRDSLGARRAASDMLLPRVDLTALFPAQAAKFVQRHGGAARLGEAVKAIRQNGAHWQLELGAKQETSGDPDVFDTVVVATQAAHAATLLGGLMDVGHLGRFDHEPIVTVYLQYTGQVKLDQPFFALIDDADSGQWGQFVFDRGQLDQNQAGLFAVVVSSSGNAIALGQEALATAIATQLASVFQRPELAQPIWARVLSEKRATFSCTPALARPKNSTDLEGLFIAGDYTASDYPATLESAIRSGVEAARAIAGARKPSVKPVAH
jgi:squalene-associated FAD-dependent desaturase